MVLLVNPLKRGREVTKISLIQQRQAFQENKHVEMTLFKEAAALKKHIEKLKQAGSVIGFVPTMGALHEGHVSLIKECKATCDVTVCSIFINPTQFTNPDDFKKYPVTIDSDLLTLKINNLDILFLPTVLEMYPEGLNEPVHYDLGEIENLLEGEFRPGHFQGVCQVVHKLLKIVQPHKLFMGLKDYQQCLVVKQLVKITNLPVDVVTVDTLRDESGLAMSSRNLRLNNEQKEQAAGISQMLSFIKDNYTTTPLKQLQEYASTFLLSHGFNKVDYVAIVDEDTLQPVTETTKDGKSIALIAATIGDVRLIDNKSLLN